MADTPAPPQSFSWGNVPQMTTGMTFGEYGSSGLRQWSGWVRDEFLPNLVGRAGMRTYREMADNSATVGALMWAIRSTMRKVEWRVIPPSDSPENRERSDFVEGLMDDMCYDDQTEVLTKRGWRRFPALRPDDLVAQRGDNDELTYVKPTARHVFDFDGELMGYQGDAVDFLVTPSHRMLFAPRRGRGHNSSREKKNALAVQRCEAIFNQSGWMSKRVVWKGKACEHSANWLEFLGFFVADGHATEKGQIYLVQKEKGYVEDLLGRAGVKASTREVNGSTQWVFHNKSLATKLRADFGAKSRVKKLPQWLKDATPVQQESFLRGFIEGDGWVSPTGLVGLYTSSQQLANDLQEIAMKASYIANYSASIQQSGFALGAERYRVALWGNWQDYGRPYLKAGRGWYKAPYKGKVYCVSVPTGIIMVRRNGKPLWCGNSHTWEEHVDEALTMLQFGFAPHEIVYKRRNGRRPGPDPRRPGQDLPKSDFDDGLIGWRRLPIRSQETVLKWFFDENGTVKGMTQQPWTGPIVDLPIEKMLLFRPSAHKGNPEGRSILRNAWRSYHFTKRIEEQEAILFERLNGLPVVRVPNALIEQAKAGDAGAVAQLNSFKMIATNLRLNEQMGLVMSSAVYEGANGQPSQIYQYDIKLVTPEVRRTGGGPNEVLDRYNLAMLQSVLADFIALGHSARGTQALSTNKTDMFFQAVEGFLNSNAAVYNRHALPRVWELNGFDHEEQPEISPDLAARVDLDVLSNYIFRLSQAGMPLFPNEEMQSYLLDAAGLPDVVDPMAMEAAGLTDELIGQQTAVATGEIPDPKAEQAMAQQQRFAPDPGANDNPKNPKAANGNFGKMVRASLARRMIKMAGPRFGVETRTSRRRMLKAADERDVWIVRHGETAANEDPPTIRGLSDVALSDKGQGQALALAAEIANEGGVDMVVHTGLARSRDTASEVAAASHATLSPGLGLQPWNLGFLTGMPVKDAAPYIVQHVREIPDTAVMGGESFNEFKRRAFAGLQEALDLSTGQRLAIVSHHWIERLVKAWQAAGAGPDLAVDANTMLEPGNATGTAELVTIDANAIRQGLSGDLARKRRLNGSSKVFLEAGA